MPNIVPVVTGEVVAQCATDRALVVKEQLLALYQDVANRFLEAGTLWAEVRDNGLWREWGEDCTSFDGCVEALYQRGQINMSPRNVFYCISITNMVTRLSLSAEDVKRISISRLREIASVPIAEQPRLLAVASAMTVDEMQREAKALRDKAAGRDTDPSYPWLFKFSKTQHDFVRECLDDARHAYSIEDHVPDPAVLSDVCLAEWKSGLALPASDA